MLLIESPEDGYLVGGFQLHGGVIIVWGRVGWVEGHLFPSIGIEIEEMCAIGLCGGRMRASKEVDLMVMDESLMFFEWSGPLIAVGGENIGPFVMGVVEGHFMKGLEYAKRNLISPMDIQGIFVDGYCGVGTGCYVPTVYFEFGP